MLSPTDFDLATTVLCVDDYVHVDRSYLHYHRLPLYSEYLCVRTIAHLRRFRMIPLLFQAKFTWLLHLLDVYPFFPPTPKK